MSGCYADSALYSGDIFVRLSNSKMADYRFLAEMYDDAYFPSALVKKGQTFWWSCACRLRRKSLTVWGSFMR
jgi:hypothetical protein